MDTHIKRGDVYLQHHKHSEKWKRYWLSLYPGSRQGVARLELTEANSDCSLALVRRQPERKVVRLAECISVVRLPPHAEAHPEENMAAFCVHTDERKLVFSVEKEECGEWVEKICEVAFQKGRRGDVSQMENQIYTSREEVCDFQVAVQQSEASARCGLQGAYTLQVGEESLVLKESESRQKVQEWPYKLLRRYGCDKVTFFIEAGRRCDSGPGIIPFETAQGDEILHLVDLAIQHQKNLVVPGGVSATFSPFSPLPKIPSVEFLLEAPSGAGPETSACPPVYLKSFQQAVYSQPADAVGTLQKSSHRHGDAEPTYSNPIDVVQPVVMHRFPNESKPPDAPQNKLAEPVYAEVLYFTPQAGRNNECSDQNTPANDGTREAKEDVIYSQVSKPGKRTMAQDRGFR